MIPLEYYIYNHICIEWDRIDEARGVPDGLRDDAKYIAAQILEHKELNNYRNFTIEIDASKLNLKFDSLTCKVIDYSGNTSIASLNPVENLSHAAVLKLHIIKKDFNFKKLIPLIGHELLHWYTYIINGEEESESVFYTRISQVDQDALFSDSKSFNEELAKKILYYVTADEVNAFITELTLTIEQEHPMNVKEAYDILFKSDLYTGYAALYNRLMKEIQDDTSLKDICSVYRKLNKYDKDLTDSQIIRKLKRQFKSIKKRMIKAVPRVLFTRRTMSIR